MRFDGGHKRDRFLTDVLARYVEWVLVCPETEIGLPTPRDNMVLEQRGTSIRMIVEKSGRDLTDEMNEFAEHRVRQLEALNLCGYVLKKNSPSCGVLGVRVRHASGLPARPGAGLFARELLTRLPGLPIEEEGRLADGRLRDAFVERIFAQRRLNDVFERDWRADDVVGFHTAHELALRARSEELSDRLGRVVAEVGTTTRPAFEAGYRRLFSEAMTIVPTAEAHVNVLLYMTGVFKRSLDNGSRSKLLRSIEEYRLGNVARSAPISLICAAAREMNDAYLLSQTYLAPAPRELLTFAD